MTIRKNKSKWQVVGACGHVYGEFKNKRDAIQRCIYIEKDINSCASPQHRMSLEAIKEMVLKNIKEE